MRKSGLISLPSERTLNDYTHWSTPHSGVQLEFIEQYISMLSDVSCQRLLVALSMDEMKIKSGLVFNKNEGRLVGFTDLGRVNSDIEELLSNESESAEEQLADSVFVFMIRAIFKPSLSVAVAHYFTRNLKGTHSYSVLQAITHNLPCINLLGEQIFSLAWEVVEAVEMYNLKVVSLTSDGAKPNRRFYR